MCLSMSTNLFWNTVAVFHLPTCYKSCPHLILHKSTILSLEIHFCIFHNFISFNTIFSLPYCAKPSFCFERSSRSDVVPLPRALWRRLPAGSREEKRRLPLSSSLGGPPPSFPAGHASSHFQSRGKEGASKGCGGGTFTYHYQTRVCAFDHFCWLHQLKTWKMVKCGKTQLW